MFNNAPTRTVKWASREEARHAVTRCLLRREGPGGTGGSASGSLLSPGSGEEDAHTATSPHMHGARRSSRAKTLGDAVLVLVGIQTSRLLTFMTLGSSAIDLWEKAGQSQESGGLMAFQSSLRPPLPARYPADLC